MLRHALQRVGRVYVGVAWLAFVRKAFPAPLKPTDNAVASAPRMLPASRYVCIQSMLSRARHSGAGTSVAEFMTT